MRVVAGWLVVTQDDMPGPGAGPGGEAAGEAMPDFSKVDLQLIAAGLLGDLPKIEEQVRKIEESGRVSQETMETHFTV